jgi:hypothetical protein
MASLGEELLNVVNRLQDLVFNTIGNDSLDLPQIVCSPHALRTCKLLDREHESAPPATRLHEIFFY